MEINKILSYSTSMTTELISGSDLATWHQSPSCKDVYDQYDSFKEAELTAGLSLSVIINSAQGER